MAIENQLRHRCWPLEWVVAVAGPIMLDFGGMWKTRGLCTIKATDCCRCGLMNHPMESIVEVVL